VSHFEWGIVGGFAANLVRLFAFINVPKRQRTQLKDWIYWLQFVSLPILGGFVATAYGDASCRLPGILPLHIGASTPALLKIMSGAVPAPRRKVG
jgi:hypothetical protein